MLIVLCTTTPTHFQRPCSSRGHPHAHLDTVHALAWSWQPASIYVSGMLLPRALSELTVHGADPTSLDLSLLQR